jgi:hypothetical protein
MANFKYVEKITTSEGLLDTIKEIITFINYDFNTTKGETQETNSWIVSHSTPDTATTKTKEMVLKSTAKIGGITKDFYVKFINPGFGSVPPNHSTLTVSLLEDYDEVTDTPTNEGHPVNMEWADENYKENAVYTDRGMKTPVYVYANVTNNKLALVIVGDPAVNFTDYRKSFLYAGAINPFTYNMDDTDGNVLLTAGAVTVEPTTALNGYYSGQYTSFGNTTMQMLGTKSGIKFQRHYPAFITQAPATANAFTGSGVDLLAQGFQQSNWTKRYHLSPCYVVHPYDGYRGQLGEVIAVTKHNILHLDELVVTVTGKTWDEEVYVFFDHNTEQNFMNHSANIKMGVAILKEVRYTP